ncbi:hypothetical protein OED01_08420 [Microbacterium sp. M28]|uniref:hypothetical protein n=1 Tax=Microbacterium sp. M28 TaxID=2962064 RepID=UPI0021F45F8A|nr:hypothetical protein [Microbacterium sp. M28]UYO95643.1 hypothetical protein OED01_08420 [Microbacterium sp. M28]
MSDALFLNVDEDGFFCLVAPDAYRGFIDEDWQLEQLFTHFVEQMNAGSLFVAHPGPDDADETVSFAGTPSGASALREATSTVHVGVGGLWVTDYTQLTMAAQFDDETATNSGAMRLPVTEGTHRVTLSQVDGDPCYVLTIKPVDDDLQPLDAVPWFA